MDIIDRVVIDPLADLYERILVFLPNLLTAFVILAVGAALGWLLKTVLYAVFRKLDADKYFGRVGMLDLLAKGGIREPFSLVISRVAGWTLVFVFAILSLSALDIPALDALLERFFLYLPSMFAAALILIFGYPLSNFIGRAALIAAVNAGIRVAGALGKLVKLAVFMLAVSMALEQLGIGRNSIVIAFAIIFGGVVFALSLAFGLAGRDMAKDYLERRFKGADDKDDINHI